MVSHNMEKAQIRNLITKFHFYLLGFSLLNFILKITIEISLNYKVADVAALLVYASGVILFFWNFKPFKKVGLYFSFYLITPFFAFLFWAFGGIFLAIVTSIVLYPIYPNDLEKEYGEISIYGKFQGFMGMCCSYQLTEKKYWLLEKKIMEINLNESIDFNKASLISTDGKSKLKIKYNKYEFGPERTVETDTIIKIKTK